MHHHRRIQTISYRVERFDGLRAFYAGDLGFKVIQDSADTLSFACHPGCAALSFHRASVLPYQAQSDDFYWKIGLTLRDLDAAVEHLRSCGHTLPDPGQFGDIGYMSRLVDPRGFQIELLQQGFEGHARSRPAGHPVGAQATLAHLTLRSADIAAAERVLAGTLNLRLMSVQPVRDYGFDLYFYGWSDEVLPDPDLKAVTNREWLWARPYTLIEVQHWLDGARSIRHAVPDQAGFSGFDWTGPDAAESGSVDMSELTDIT